MVNRSKILILVFILVVTLVGAAKLSSGRSQKPVDSFAAPFLLVSPSPYASPKISTESEVLSPDGKMTLKMKEVKDVDSAKYIFTITDNLTGEKKELLTKTLPITDRMLIPDNTFSPDNKYVFLTEMISNNDYYLVLTTSGDFIKNDQKTVEISELFKAKYENYKITDVTGWGGINLLVVNTDKVDGTVGPSFWFELPAETFIQLSTRFN